MVEGVRRVVRRELASAERGAAVFRIVYPPALAALIAGFRWSAGFELGVHGVLAVCVLLLWTYSGVALALLREGRFPEGLTHLSALVDAAAGALCLGLSLAVQAPLWRELLPGLAALYLLALPWLAAARMAPANAVVSGVFAAAAAAVVVLARLPRPEASGQLVLPALLPFALVVAGVAAWRLSQRSLRLLREHYLRDELVGVRSRLTALDRALTAGTEEVNAAAAEIELSTGAAVVRFSQEQKAIDTAASVGERLGAGATALGEGIAAITDLAERSLTAVGQAVEAIQQTSSEIAAAREVAHRMGASLDLINEVTDQTNLLALNAAIEAARGQTDGEDGFTVVAEEIRTLAERSAGIAAEIGRLVKQIKGAVEAGGAASEKAGHTLERIRIDMTDLQGRLQQVGASLEEQAAAVTAVREGLEKAQGLGAQGAAAAEAMRRLGAGLRTLGSSLRRVLDRPVQPAAPATSVSAAPAPRRGEQKEGE